MLKITTESDEDTVVVAPEASISPKKKIVPGMSPKRKFENLNVSKSVSLNQGDLTASISRTSENVSPDISQRKASEETSSFTFDNPRETLVRKNTDVN